MSRSFSSLGEFAAFMEARIATLPSVKKAVMEDGSKIILDEVKVIPGNYQPGWAPLKPATIARKKMGDTPLLETGGMRDSYDRTIRASEASIGSNDMKAVWQEMGTSTIPPRPVLRTAGVRKRAEVCQMAGRRIIKHFA